MLNNGSELLPNASRGTALRRDNRLIETDGLKGNVHLALIRTIELLLKRTGRKAFVPHSLWLLGKLFGRKSRAQWFILPDVFLNVSMSDRYWMGVALTGEYEPDLLAFLSSLPHRETLFLDCGANIGWWSLMAEKRFGWRCVAVEAAPDVVGKLEENRKSGDAAFEIVNRAIWDREGERLQFLTGADIHAGGHLKDVAGFLRWRAPKTEEVVTTTIDAQVDRALESGSSERIVVKIDVEGAEKHALVGARHTIERGAVMIYEDHGSDPTCEPTKAVLESGMLVYAILNGLLRPIATVEEALQVKSNPRMGYNFAALSPTSPFLPDIHALMEDTVCAAK